MNYFFYPFCVWLFLCVGTQLKAQDKHFSQFYASPLTLNPALTGNMHSDIRATLHHRVQWSGIGSKFQTTAIGAEINFTEWSLVKKVKADKLGFGVYALSDQLTDVVSSNALFISIAYHKALDHELRHHISGGIQTGFTQKKFDSENLLFSSQYDYEELQFNNQIVSGEPFNNANISYMDVYAGLYYTYKLNPVWMLKSGMAFYDLGTPKETVFRDIYANVKTNVLNTRFVWHASADFHYHEQWTFTPRLLFMGQAKGQNINLGGEAAYKLKGKTNITFLGGLWTRFKDAFIVSAGARYDAYEFRISYDANISKLGNITEATNSSGSTVNAWEISFIYNGLLNRPVPKHYYIPCGTF